MAPILGIIASSIQSYSPVGSYDSIASITVPSGGLSSITFAGIPAGYRHLQLRAAYSSDNGDYDWSIRFNGDASSNYTKHQIGGNGSSAFATGSTSQTAIPGGYATNASQSSAIVDVLDYASISKYTTVRVLTGSDANGAGLVGLRSGLWINTNAVSSIVLIPTSGATSFSQYSNFSLYGVK